METQAVFQAETQAKNVSIELPPSCMDKSSWCDTIVVTQTPLCSLWTWVSDICEQSCGSCGKLFLSLDSV